MRNWDEFKTVGSDRGDHDPDTPEEKRRTFRMLLVASPLAGAIAGYFIPWLAWGYANGRAGQALLTSPDDLPSLLWLSRGPGPVSGAALALVAFLRLWKRFESEERIDREAARRREAGRRRRFARLGSNPALNSVHRPESAADPQDSEPV